MPTSTKLHLHVDGQVTLATSPRRHLWLPPVLWKIKRTRWSKLKPAKLRHIIKKAKIQRGHRVLEIGSGWGSFAMEVRAFPFFPNEELIGRRS